jgi:hypothetical protein
MTQPDEDFLVQEGEFGEIVEPEVRDLEAPPEDAVEQAIPADPAEQPEIPRVSFEANEADAVEQATLAMVGDLPERPRVPLEANEADAVEQAQIVTDTDDDDYR